jgi:hypothetical protein
MDNKNYFLLWAVTHASYRCSSTHMPHKRQILLEEYLKLDAHPIHEPAKLIFCRILRSAITTLPAFLKVIHARESDHYPV